MQSVAIIDYGINNIRSIRNAVEYCGSSALATKDANDLRDASHIILPGVGAFGDAMEKIRLHGLDHALRRVVLENGKPFLAICLGMQLLAETSTEHADIARPHQGLGWLSAEVLRLESAGPTIKVPHMGWNTVLVERVNPVLAGIHPGNLSFYFVHSFALYCHDPSVVIGRVEYGQHISAIVAWDNIIATQFHPEKSQDSGIELLSNFLQWNP